MTSIQIQDNFSNVFRTYDPEVIIEVTPFLGGLFWVTVTSKIWQEVVEWERAEKAIELLRPTEIDWSRIAVVLALTPEERDRNANSSS